MERVAITRYVRWTVMVWFLLGGWAIVYPIPAGAQMETIILTNTLQFEPVQLGRLTTDDGLPSNHITAITQSADGIIWIGTPRGLARYDGYHVHVYSAMEGELSADQINDLAVTDSALWIATERGSLDRLDLTTGAITTPIPPDKLTPIRAMDAAADGTIWLLTEDGEPVVWEPDRGAWRVYPSVTGRRVPPHIDIKSDPNRHLWIALSENNLLRFDPTSGDVAHLPLNDNARARILQWGADNTLWVGAGNSVLQLNPTTGDILFELPLNRARAVLFHLDKQNRIWAGSRLAGGVRMFRLFDDKTSEQQRHINPDDGGDDAITPYLTTYFESGDGVMWFGSADSGIYTYSDHNNQFGTIRLERPAENPYAVTTMGALLRDRFNSDIAWFTVGLTLNRWDTTTQNLTTYVPTNRNEGQPPISTKVDFITQPANGIIWLDDGQGVLSFNPATEQFTSHPAPVGDGFFVDASGGERGIWLISEQEIMRFGIEKRQYELFPLPDAYHAPDGLIASSPRGVVWLFVNDQLVLFDYPTAQFSSISTDLIGVGTLFVGHEGDVWVAAADGLHHFAADGNLIRSWLAEDGIPTIVTGIVPRPERKFWLLSNYGLVAFDPQNEQGIEHLYTTAHGLPSNQIVSAETRHPSPVPLIITHPQRMTLIDPARLTTNQYEPPIKITAVRLFNQPFAWAGEPIELPHDENFLSFDIATLSYVNPDLNQLRYRLDGLEDSWQTVSGGSQQLSYAGLAPGNYTLRVQGSNSDGVWSPQEAILSIIITPPWWQMWWFRVLVVAVAAVLAYAWYQQRVRVMKMQNAQLEKQVELRTMELAQSNRDLQIAKNAADAASHAKSAFLANMSHELRTPLNAILGYTTILKREEPAQNNRLNIIEDSGKHLLTLINDVLDIAKVEAGKLELFTSPFALSLFLDQIVAMMRPHATNKQLAFHVNRAAELPHTIVADEKRLRQVLLNLLSNAFKFTETGSVTLAVDCPVPNTLRFTIRDTGIGIPEARLQEIFQPFMQGENRTLNAQGAGLGLSISRQLVTLMGGDLSAESEPNIGSTFTFTVPLLNELSALTSPEHTSTIIGIKGIKKSAPQIVVVDDKWQNRAVILDLLQPLGFIVHVADDGRSALALINDLRPDCIITDLIMPDIDGFELIQQLRQSIVGERIKIIAMSASVHAGQQKRTLQIGADSFLSKPININTLLNTLGDLLDLTWVVQEPAETATGEAQPMILPPADTLQTLLHNTRRGSVAAIRQEIERLTAENEDYRPFHAQVSLYLSQYRMQKLREWLETIIQS